MMLQMSSLMRGGAPGAPGGPGSFPAPGLPSTARPQGQDGQSQYGSTPTAGAPGAGVPPMLFPFAPPSPAGGSNAAPPGGLFDPALMQQMLAAMGGGAGAGAGAGLGAGGGGTDPFGLGAFGGLGRLGAFGGAPAAPTDTRPPEERFQVQLQVSTTPLSRDELALTGVGIDSNCKIWASRTRSRTCARSLRPAATSIPPLSIYLAGAVSRHKMPPEQPSCIGVLYDGVRTIETLQDACMLNVIN